MLHCGSEPLFSRSSLQESLTPYSLYAEASVPRGTFLQCIDNQLDEVWNTVKTFCSTINLAATSGPKITETALLDIVISVLYRLLQMKFHTRPLNEADRLGQLAICSHIFLQFRGARSAFLHLSDTYRTCLLQLESTIRAPPHLMLWLLNMGAI